jgi:hypothetical protein
MRLTAILSLLILAMLAASNQNPGAAQPAVPPGLSARKRPVRAASRAGRPATTPGRPISWHCPRCPPPGR